MLKQAVTVRKAAEEIYYEPILEKHQNDVISVSYLSDGRAIDLTKKELSHFKVLRYWWHDKRQGQPMGLGMLMREDVHCFFY